MKKISFLLLLFGLLFNCHSQTGNDRLPEISSMVVAGIDLTEKIEASNLKNLQPATLRLLRNEIFARKGYKFKSTDLDRYFKQFDWYQPQFDEISIEGHLTEIDKYNINFIKNVEKDFGNATPDEKFIEYLSLIPDIKLPLDFTCENGFQEADINHTNPFIRKYNPEGALVIGKLYSSENEVGIIYGYIADTFYPILTKFNLKGEEIEDVAFFKFVNCSGGPGYSATTKGTITKDLAVKTQTKILQWDIETEGSQIDTVVFENEFSIK